MNSLSQSQRMFKETVTTWLNIADMAKKYHEGTWTLKELNDSIEKFVQIDAINWNAARLIAEAVAEKEGIA